MIIINISKHFDKNTTTKYDFYKTFHVAILHCAAKNILIFECLIPNITKSKFLSLPLSANIPVCKRIVFPQFQNNRARHRGIARTE